MFEAEYFVYNGVNSQDLGITQVQINLNNLFEEMFMGDANIQEYIIPKNEFPYLQTVQHSPFQFNLTFSFDTTQNATSLNQIAKILYTKQYAPFYTDLNTNRIYYCMPTSSSKIGHNGSGQGYVTLTMRCDSPYAYLPEVTTNIYDFSPDGYGETTVTDFEKGTLVNVVATNGAATPVVGVQMPAMSAPTFTRNSVANLDLDDDFTQVTANQPRYERGYFHNLLSDDIATGGETSSSTESFTTDGSGMTISYDTSTFWQGLGSIKCVQTANKQDGARTMAFYGGNYNTEISDGTYVVSCYLLQTTGVQIYLDVQIFDENMNFLEHAITNNLVSDVTKTTWQRMSDTITVSDVNAKYISYKFFTVNPQSANTTFWIDGLQLEIAQKKDTIGNYIPLDWILPSQGKAILIEEGTTNLVQNSDFETVTTTAQVFADSMATDLSAWTTQSGSFTVVPAVMNLVKNSDFETVTTTAQVFSDALTEYTGTTVPAPWTLQSGSFTFGASGATCDAVGSLITAGNAQWKPILGSDGTTKLVLKVQSEFTTTSTPSTSEFGVYLYIDANNQYLVNVNGTGSNAFPILKKSSGTYTTLNSVAFTPVASTTYTVSLEIDNTGNLTATITPLGGSTTTLTATDPTPLTGGFLIGVGGDTGVVISNASVTAPFANGWNIGGDSRVAWGLNSANPISGKYSLSAVVPKVQGWIYPDLVSATAGQEYTLSAYSTSSDNIPALEFIWSDNTAKQIGSSVTNSIQAGTDIRSTFTQTAPANTASLQIYINIFAPSSTEIYVFDAIQLETGSTAHAYVRNDSTTTTATTPAGASSEASGSIITAGNPVWKPVLGSDGATKLALTAQATFTTQSTVTGNSGRLILNKDSQNQYLVQIENNQTFHLYKVVGNVTTGLISANQTFLPSTDYHITLSLDPSGNLTAKLYQGVDETGILLQTLTAVDTSLTGGFLVGVGGDTGVIVSNTSVTAPWVNGFPSLSGDLRVAWGLTDSSPINGKYSISAVGVKGVAGYFDLNTIPVSASTNYTMSTYWNGSNVGTDGTYLGIAWFNGASYLTTTYDIMKSGSFLTERKIYTAESPSNATNANPTLFVSDVGTVVFDAVQFESKPYQTTYLENPSTTTSATRNAEVLTYPATLFTPSAGAIRFIYTPNLSSTQAKINEIVLAHFTEANANGAPSTGSGWFGYSGYGNIGISDISLDYPMTFNAGDVIDLCVSWNATTVYLYVNGVNVANTPKPTNWSLCPNNAIYIGSYADDLLQANGTIDELIIYNYTPTDADITSLYNATAPQTITDEMNLLAQFDSNLTYASGGYRTSPAIDLSWITDLDETTILWTDTTPINTTLNVLTSVDGGLTWQTPTNGGSIPNLTVDEDLAGKSLLIKESLTMNDATQTTPVLSNLTINETVFFTLTNGGDVNCPFEVWITKVGNGDVTLTNTSNGNEIFSFTGLSDGETVYVDTFREYITSSLPNTYRYDNFNDNYFDLVVGDNKISSLGSCKLQFRYNSRLLAGF